MHKDHILTKVGGQVLIIAIIFLAVILILAATMFSKVSSFLRFGTISAEASQATALAEAGVDNTLWQLNLNAGSCPQTTCLDEIPLGTIGTFKVTIANDPANPSIKTISSTGYIPNSTNPKSKRTVKVQVGIDNTTIAFNYAVQTNVGGFFMNSNAVINGNAYTNGNIIGSGNSTINGDAYAVGTISSPDPFVTGSIHPGSSSKPLPYFDNQYWKDKANINNDPYIGNLVLTGTNNNLGPKKIQGDLTLSNNAWLTLHGPIFVTGNFTMNANSILYLDNSFGSKGTVLIVDGTITLNSNSQVYPTNATPKGYIILATTKNCSCNSIILNSNGKSGVIYALNSTILINSNANIVAMAANQLNLDSNATINYDQGLALAQFTTGPGGSWLIKKGTYKQTGSP